MARFPTDGAVTASTDGNDTKRPFKINTFKLKWF